MTADIGLCERSPGQRCSDASYHSAMETRPPLPRAQPSFQRRIVRSATVLVVGLTLVALAVFGALQSGIFGDDEVGVEPVPTPDDSLSADERAAYEYLAPRLHELAAQARELARLGQERSRNIFDLQAHTGRLAALADEIDSYVVANGTPARFQLALASYEEGIRLARRAIDEAQRAILSADWDRLERVVAVFTAGAEELEDAALRLDIEGGAATPAAQESMPQSATARERERNRGIHRAV